jgi:uncharacterized protein (TIGR02646 family)
VKRVPQLAKAPPGLLTFLENEPAGNWEQFRNYLDHAGNSAYKELILALEQAQSGLCAYCEINLRDIDRQVEHFHPKSDDTAGVNWTFIPSNLFAACKGGTNLHTGESKRSLPPAKLNLSCGEAKGKQILDGEILNPAMLPEKALVFLVNDEGKIEANKSVCEATATDFVKAQATVVRLNLNCKRLMNARADVWQFMESDFEQRIESGESELDALADMAATYLTPDSQGRLQAFFTTIHSYCGGIASSGGNPVS